MNVPTPDHLIDRRAITLREHVRLLETLLHSAWERMDTCRAILHKDEHSLWLALDTTLDRATLAKGDAWNKPVDTYVELRDHYPIKRSIVMTAEKHAMHPQEVHSLLGFPATCRREYNKACFCWACLTKGGEL